MREDLADADILALCQPLDQQLAWRYVAYKYLLQADPEARRPLSQVGSLRGGGRYNVGLNLSEHHQPFGAIYTSFEAETATQEMRFPQAEETPYMLFPLRATLERVLDLRNGEVIQALDLDEKKLYGDWRERSKILGLLAYPQQVGVRLFDAGVEAILTHSVAAEKLGTNLTIYPGNLAGDSRVSVSADIDDPTVVDVLVPRA